jgi:hypothetical protein
MRNRLVTFALVVGCLVVASGCSGSSDSSATATDASTGSAPKGGQLTKDVKLEDCYDDVGGHDVQVSRISCGEADDLLSHLWSPDANKLAVVPENKQPEASHESVYTSEGWTCWATSVQPFGVRHVCFSGDRLIIFTIT